MPKGKKERARKRKELEIQHMVHFLENTWNNKVQYTCLECLKTAYESVKQKTAASSRDVYSGKVSRSVDADICLESLTFTVVIELDCGHVMHYRCLKDV